MSQVRTLSPGVVCDPERYSGQPSIEGRRLSAHMVANAAVADGCDRGAYRGDFDLTDAQIDAALEWDRRGRPE